LTIFVDESESQVKALPVQPSTLPVSDKPVTLSLSKAPAKLTSSMDFKPSLMTITHHTTYAAAVTSGPSKIPVLGFDDSEEASDEIAADPNKRTSWHGFFLLPLAQ